MKNIAIIMILALALTASAFAVSPEAGGGAGSAFESVGLLEAIHEVGVLVGWEVSTDSSVTPAAPSEVAIVYIPNAQTDTASHVPYARATCRAG